VLLAERTNSPEPALTKALAVVPLAIAPLLVRVTPLSMVTMREVPAAARLVGTMSNALTGSSTVRPAETPPSFHRSRNGTRMPPSRRVPLFPRSGSFREALPGGAPLSLKNQIMVRSSWPVARSVSSSWPMSRSHLADHGGTFAPHLFQPLTAVFRPRGEIQRRLGGQQGDVEKTRVSPPSRGA
jgi:hypothetical protein